MFICCVLFISYFLLPWLISSRFGVWNMEDIHFFLQITMPYCLFHGYRYCKVDIEKSCSNSLWSVYRKTVEIQDEWKVGSSWVTSHARVYSISKEEWKKRRNITTATYTVLKEDKYTLGVRHLISGERLISKIPDDEIYTIH